MHGDCRERRHRAQGTQDNRYFADRGLGDADGLRLIGGQGTAASPAARPTGSTRTAGTAMMPRVSPRMPDDEANGHDDRDTADGPADTPT